ncbi:glutamine amidotransferase [Mycobacteroides franklinii]|uniref:Glutamine amidotransferase n=1 Tax=Mycobacteroides franklinii TaxID=948102 RepID=A0A1S1L339_9MYCO|nr:DJ-1/PfpI family protein [Mycobacteroides franklinii]OHU21254.1 glutamine amidotransferase [Mycobacteroides franklinii]
MTQIALVLFPGFTALDLVGPYEVLRFLPEAEVRFVWHEVGPITADSGALVLGATHTFEETQCPDIVVVPGGNTSVAVHARDEVLLSWLRSANSQATWTTSVCGGSLILAAAGLLEGCRATSHWQGLQLLRPFGAIPIDNERIVHEGNIVTCAGVSAGIDLALWIAREVGGSNRAEAIQLAIEYDPMPPLDSGHFNKASLEAKTTARALLARESVNGPQIRAITALLWRQALGSVRQRAQKRGWVRA